ncbi:MAG: type III-B CRISPR module RAMP protein Cmr4 [Thermoproteota archaeon]|jgi:CRISPR-associated protein Cmr4
MSEQQLVVSPYETCDLILIKAVTNLHPGVGRTGEIIDLPIQRDNLGFPILYSSSLKGALKSAFWQLSNTDKENVKDLFGPEPTEGETFTSAVAVLDAFVVAFPVRSLEGIYAFATSPLLLKRLNDLLKMSGKTYSYISDLLKLYINKGTCQASQEAKELLEVKPLNDKLVVNEDLLIECKIENSDNIKKLEDFLEIEHGRLILLSDYDVLDALEKSLVRITRIAVDREKKVVKEGALWTEEYVPWNTTFATLVLYSKSKKPGSNLQTSSKVREEFRKLLERTKNYLIVGGDETIGRGIVRLHFPSA